MNFKGQEKKAGFQMKAMKYKQTFEINSAYKEIEKAFDSFTDKRVSPVIYLNLLTPSQITDPNLNLNSKHSEGILFYGRVFAK